MKKSSGTLSTLTENLTKTTEAFEKISSSGTKNKTPTQLATENTQKETFAQRAIKIVKIDHIIV